MRVVFGCKYADCEMWADLHLTDLNFQYKNSNRTVYTFLQSDYMDFFERMAHRLPICVKSMDDRMVLVFF